jgi:hypothetical protein
MPADNGSLKTFLPNLLSGVLTIPEMFLATYTILDLLAHEGFPSDYLDNQSLNDFVLNRPYSTKAVGHSLILRCTIYGLSTISLSADSYLYFAKYQFREPSPQSWVLKDFLLSVSRT